MFKDIFYFLLYLKRTILKPILGFKEITVLLYHSVAENDWYASVDPETFDKQMEYLKKYYNVVSLDEIIQYIKGEIDLPDKSVAITFDDGYADNYQKAWPILQKYQLPATIFLTTDLSSHKSLNNNLERLSWQQVKEMSKQGVEIGGHGQTHKDLDSLMGNSLETEIKGCQIKLTEQLKGKPKHFSYPGGKFNNQVKKTVKESGWQSAYATEEGLIMVDADEFAIKRVWVHRGTSFLAFKARLTKVIDWLARVKKLLII